MKKPSVTITIVALLAWFSPAQSADVSPDWTLTSVQGQSVQLSEEVQQQPVILLFWATYCEYCKALMPHLQSIVDEYDGEIEVLALNFRDDEDPMDYISERGFDFRVFPQSDPVAELWGVKATPGLFLVDKTGRAVFSNYAIPQSDYPTDTSEQVEGMKHYQKAARKAPFWAARLRLAIDKMRMQKAP